MRKYISIEATVEEIELAAKESIDKLSTKNSSIKEFLLKIFKEGNNSFVTYQNIKYTLKQLEDKNLKEKLFEAIKDRKYNKIRELFVNEINYIKRIEEVLDKVEKEKFISLRDKIISKNISLIPNNKSTIYGSEKLKAPNLFLGSDMKIYFDGIPLILRKYKKNNLKLSMFKLK